MFCAECGARASQTGPVPPPGAISSSPPLPGTTSAPLPAGVAPQPPAPFVPAVPAHLASAPPSAPSVPSVPGADDQAAPAVAHEPDGPGLAPPPPPSPPAVHADVPPVFAAPVRPADTFPVVPGRVAPVGTRVGAFAIDVVALALVAGLGVLIASLTVGTPAPGDVSATAGIVSFLPAALGGLGGLALWISEARTGATLGGWLLGIRTVSVRTGRPAGFLAIFLRQLIVGLGAVACYVGQWVVVASGAFDKTPAQRGWHDRVAGTLVLRAGATGVARSADPDAAWDHAVARAVGGAVPPAPLPPAPVPPAPVPPAPVSPAPVPPAPVPPAPVPPAPVPPAPAPVPPAPAPAVPVPPAPGTPLGAAPGSAVPPPPAPPVPALAPAPPVPPAPAAEPRARTGAVADAPPSEPVVTAPLPAAPVISLVPLPPGVGTGRPTGPAAPDARLITGFPGSGGAPTGGALAGAGDVPAPSDVVGEPRLTSGPVTPPAPPVRRDLVEDLDELELTRMREPETLDAQPGVRGLRLVFDTGERVDVVGEGVVGRAPQAAPGIDHVVAIDDPARSVSKVHLAFGPTDHPDELWVIDRGSTNGSVVVRPDGSAATLPAGARATVGPGWSVRFGDRTVVVERR